MIPVGRWIFVMGIAATIMLIACSDTSETAANVSSCDAQVENLLISESDFPEQWFTGQTYRSASHHYALHRCTRSFMVLNGNAHQEIYEYADTSEASRQFARQKARFFGVNRYATPWKEPAFAGRLDLSSSDEFYLACQSYGGTEICQLLAQYGRFTVVFASHMSPDYMSGDNFIRIIEAINRTFGGAAD